MNEFDHFIGTRAVSPQNAFDIPTLDNWLIAALPGYCGPLSVEIFKGGQSNPTYKLTTPSRTYVMRSKPGPVAKLLPSAHAVEREYRVMQGLQNTAVPLPAMYCLCEDESIIGRAFYVMEYVQGRILWDQSLPEMAPSSRSKIYDQMNQVISRLHCVDYKRKGLELFGKPGNYFERQIGRWSKQYIASVTRHIPEMEKLIEWLPKNIPSMARSDSIVSIVHGDYRLDNLMFSSEKEEIIAVLDWELSTLGHPLADFSYHCMAWHIPPGVFRGIAGLDLSKLGIPTETEYIRKYCERTGLAQPEDLANDWNFYMAYNMFRIAAIMQGIAKRVQTGTATNAQAVNAAAGAGPLAQMAWAFAMQG